MGIARIIARAGTDVSPLTDKLRARGFEVEVCSPDNIPARAADVELRVESCSTPDQALNRALHFAGDTYVDTGVVPGADQTSAAQAQRDSEAQREAEAAKARAEAAIAMQRTLEEQRRREADAAAQEQARLRAEAERRQAEEAERARIESERQRAEAEAEQHRQAEAELQRAEAEAQAVAMRERMLRDSEQQKVAQTASVDPAQHYAQRAEPLYAVAMSRQAPPPPINRARQWKMAAIAALIVAVAGALVWAAISSRRPANPVGAATSQPGAQPAQYGGVTVAPGGGVTLAAPQAAPPKSQAAQAAPARKPAPQAHAAQRTASKPSAQKNTRRAAKSNRRGSRDIADDVTIRHFTRPAASPRPQQQRAGLKVISDM